MNTLRQTNHGIAHLPGKLVLATMLGRKITAISVNKDGVINSITLDGVVTIYLATTEDNSGKDFHPEIVVVNAEGFQCIDSE